MRKFLLSLVALLCATVSFAQTELLTNGGFETWNGDVPAGWCSQSWSNAAISASSTAHSGSKAAQMVNTSKDGNQRIASDVINLKAGTYTYTAYTRALEGQAAARLGYVPATKQADGSYKVGSYSWGYNQNKVNGPDTISTEWFKQTYTFTLKETTALTLCVMHSKNFGSATILLDDASLTTTDGGISTEEAGGDTETPDTPVIVDAEHISIAEFLQKADVNTTYELTGTVTSIANTTFGNLYIEEDGASVFVYGILDEKGQAKNFASLNIAVGDLLTIQGKYKVYNDAPEIENAQFISVVKAGAYECVGDGTEQNPYTAEDVKHLVGTVDKTAKFWVTGTVLGCCKSGTEITYDVVESNIALGDPDCWVPVQLPVGEVRDALNLVANPEIFGQDIAVYGTLEAYFSVAGVKNVTGYTIYGGEDIEIVPADATALTGTWNTTTLLMVDPSGMGFPTPGKIEEKTISVVGDAEGNVTITGLLSTPVTGNYGMLDFGDDEPEYLIMFPEYAPVTSADWGCAVAAVLPEEGLIAFVSGIANEAGDIVVDALALSQNANLGGCEVFEATVIAADMMTGAELEPMTTTCYVMDEGDGDYAILNLGGFSAVGATKDAAGNIVLDYSEEWPYMIDFMSEDGCIVLTKDAEGNYSYEGQAYFGPNAALSIKLTKKGGADAIKSVAEQMAQGFYYNLMGQKAGNGQKGIVIKNGKKVLVK